MTEPKTNLEQLLRTGVATARAGNRDAARALFLALTRAYPGEVRAWLGLAGVAESAHEQREALEHVIAIDPDHAKARAALARLAPLTSAHAAEPPPAPPIPPRAPADAPGAMPAAGARTTPPIEAIEVEDSAAATRRRFPLLNLIATAIIALLIIALITVFSGIIPNRSQAAATPASLPSPVLQPTPPTLTAAAPPTAPIAAGESPSPEAEGTRAPSPSTGAAATSTATPTTPASLPLGTLVEVDGWSTTLLRPDYALVLDGSIGDLQPSGQFVLALVAISNNSDAPRRIPAELFTLVDSQGRRYSPTPNASSAYLALYTRGQHGDLALEDSLAPRSGMRSVPILFDVPRQTTGLVLTVQGSGAAGWPIAASDSPPPDVGP